MDILGSKVWDYMKYQRFISVNLDILRHFWIIMCDTVHNPSVQRFSFYCFYWSTQDETFSNDIDNVDYWLLHKQVHTNSNHAAKRVLQTTKILKFTLLLTQFIIQITWFLFCISQHHTVNILVNFLLLIQLYFLIYCEVVIFVFSFSEQDLV